MNVTPRQREEWERKNARALEDISEKISQVEQALELLISARDRIEAMTVEDAYFEYLSEQGSER